jgi:hypothetical protein
MMVLLAQCVSTFHMVTDVNTTFVNYCPDTVRYEYRLTPRTPMEVARIKHLTSGPRDDRMAVEPKREKRIVKKAIPKKVTSKKATSKKRIAKRKKRR